MLHKSKSTRNALLKYGLSAPLFAGMMILSSASFKSEKVAEKIGDISLGALDRIQSKETTESEYERFLQKNPTIQGLEWRSASQVYVILKNGKKQSYELNNPADLKKAEGLYGQFPGPPPPPPPTREAIAVVSAVDEPGAHYSSIDQTPEFPGGMKAFYEYISKNFKYPDAAKKESIAGKIIMNFVVELDGKLSDIQVLRGLGSGLDEEAVRLLKESPKWKPGIQKGKAVRVQYTLPITVSPPGQKTGAIGLNITKDKLTTAGADSKTLYIVDGKEIKSDALSSVDSKSIKSMNILNGESAISKYGDKGKDGVIEIYVNTIFPPGSKNTVPVVYFATDSASDKSGDIAVKGQGSKVELGDFSGLILHDGVEINREQHSKIDRNTVGSINVLKGESAVKKYGDRGKNGVVEIMNIQK